MSAPPAPTSADEPPSPQGSGAAASHLELGADPQCREAVAELYAFLDGELDEMAMVQVEEHLRRCSPCLEAFDFETELRRVIVARCAEEVPPELRERFCALLRSLADGDDLSGGVVDPGVPAAPDRS